VPDSLAEATRAGARLRHLRVGIVGGGLAGLAAGWFLQECGVGGVTVFEAADRLGGRVHTGRDMIPGRIVEAGAELIGSNHDLWQDLADRFGLDLDPITTDDDYKRMGARVRLRLLGQELTDAQIKELKDGLAPHLDVLGAEADPIPWETPWTAPDADSYDNMSVADRLDLLPGLTPLQRAAIQFTLGNDACARPWTCRATSGFWH
jgi:monoamine oxidase